MRLPQKTFETASFVLYFTRTYIFSPNLLQSIWVALDEATLMNGCLFFIPGSHLQTGFENPGIGKNMGAIFEYYPQFKASDSVAASMKAGSCSFHNGLLIYGANPNMTPGYRRAMTCAYMPGGSTYNGTQNILSDGQVSQLSIGDVLDDDKQNPLLYSKQLL